jgi:hypothetical protein
MSGFAGIDLGQKLLFFGAGEVVKTGRVVPTIRAQEIAG